MLRDEEMESLLAARERFKIGRKDVVDVQDENSPSKRQKSISEPLVVKKNLVDQQEPVIDGDDEGESLLLHEVMIEKVLEHYSSLLNSKELNVLEAFNQLGRNAKDVFVRLHGRKYRIFRCSSLSVRKIDELEEAVLELQKAKFACVAGHPLNLFGERERALAFLRLAKVNELRSIASSLGVVDRQKLSRDDLIRTLADMCCCDAGPKQGSSQSTLSYIGSSKGDTEKKSAKSIESALCKALACVEVSGNKKKSLPRKTQSSTLLSMWKKNEPNEEVTKEDGGKGRLSGDFVSKHGVVLVLAHSVCALFDRIEMLYFLNMSSVKLMILSVIQKVKYPQVACNRFGSPFLTRQQMVEYEGSSHLLDQFVTALGMAQAIEHGSNEVPIPGRSLNHVSLHRDSKFCSDLIWLVCRSFVQDKLVNYDFDPLKGSNHDLENELLHEMERVEQTSLNDYVERLYEQDRKPWICFEPPQDDKLKESQDQQDEEVIMSQKLSDSQQRMYMRRFRKEYIFLYILKFGVDWLEKERKYQEAVIVLRLLICLDQDIRVFVKRKVGTFWLRCSINYAHLERDKLKALSVARQAVATDACDLSLAYTIKMKQRIVMLCKATKNEVPRFPLLERLASIRREHITGHLVTRKVGRRSVFEGADGDGVHVEEFVLQHYAQNGGWNGIHTEGSVWRTIFCLLMWDIIFDDTVPFVFQQPFQSEPLDLHTHFFYKNREESIHKFLDQVRTMDSVSDLLKKNYEENKSCVSPGVRWDYSVETLCEIVECLERNALAQLLLYAAKDYRSFGKGLPDLTLWRTKTNGTKILLMEVKGPRDRLFAEQEAHLIKLNEMGIPAIVCHVAEPKTQGPSEDDDDHDNDDFDDD